MRTDCRCRRVARLLIGGALAAAAQTAAAAECGAAISGPGRLVAEAAGLRVVFATSDWPIEVGRHFRLDGVVCGPHGAVQSVALRADADMPAHRHGMNYRAVVRAAGEGRFTAEGLMFHMPGRWRFVFDIDGAQPLRVTREVEVQ